MSLTKFQAFLVYIAAGYLVIGGSFDIFSLMPNMQWIVSIMRILNVLSLFILALSSGKKVNNNIIFFFAILFIYSVLSGTLFSLNFGFIEAVLELLLLYVFVSMYEKTNGCHYLYEAFINIVSILAGVSFIVWLLGPCLDYVEPIDTIELERGDKVHLFKNYYYICFTVNEGNFFDFILAPNICFFREKAFAATIFLLALIGEMFVTKRRSTKVMVVLYLSLLSTLSTTSVLLGFWVFVLYLFGKSGYKLSFAKVLSVFIFIAALSSIEFIIQDKMDTHSGESRMSDLTNGIHAWLLRPLFGYGFQPKTIYDKYSTGYSNSISQILVSGGLYLAYIYIYPIVKTLFRSINKRDVNRVCFILSLIPIFAINRCAFIFIIFYIFIFLYQNITSYRYGV